MVDVESLLIKVDDFIDTIHVVQDAISLPPTKKHLSACINYSDLIEMRDEFVIELVNTIVPFVYSQTKQDEMLETFRRGRTDAGAWSELIRRSKKKFRTSNLRGQYAELLLCNILQHYFRAAPLLRKMPITTNPQLERNGADAIHVGVRGDRYVLYLGEAKTYARKADSFKDALTDAIRDAVEIHYPNHRREIDCYIYEDFLPKELEEVAEDYKAGRLQNIDVEIVCLAAFEETATIDGKTRDERLANVLENVYKLATPATFKAVLERIPAAILPRMNYVVMPIARLDELIAAFHAHLGGT